MTRKTKRIQVRKRNSRIAGAWGFAWLHADKNGMAVLWDKSSIRTVNGFLVRLPDRYITVVFRRRELKL